MKQIASKQIQLVSRPSGLPVSENFKLVEVPIGPIQDQQVLVRNLFLSVDPYMRGRMNDAPSYVPPFELNHSLEGGAVGVVLETRDSKIKAGDIVVSNYGWRDHFVASTDEVRLANPELKPYSVHLGLLGMTGLTAWAGLKHVGVKKGETVYISGAAGAVGSAAGQLAKIYGCKVFGSAGSMSKVTFLIEECGFDNAFNYKDGSIKEQLERLAPEGIDVYFDNVGGEGLEAALSALRLNGRIVACGGISAYNAQKSTPGPTNLFNFITKRLTMKGLIVRDWVDRQAEFEKEVGEYYRTGKIRNKETVVVGIEQAVSAFIGLFEGKNIGKMIVQL